MTVIGGNFGGVCGGGKRVPSSVGVMKKLEKCVIHLQIKIY